MRGFPVRHGLPWTRQEYKNLALHLAYKMDLELIAHKHQRTVFAIECAINRLKESGAFIIRGDSSLMINGTDYEMQLSLAKCSVHSLVDSLCDKAKLRILQHN